MTGLLEILFGFLSNSPYAIENTRILISLANTKTSLSIKTPAMPIRQGLAFSRLAFSDLRGRDDESILAKTRHSIYLPDRQDST